MALVRQEHQACRGAIGLQRLEHALRLHRVRAWIVVRLAMDEEQRLVDPIRVGERRHAHVDIARLPEGAALALEAERRQRAIPGFTIQPQSVAIGRYVAVLARRNAALRDEIDQILRQAMKDGSLEKIFRRWRVWSDDQARFYARMVSGEPVVASAGSEAEVAAPAASEWQTARRYLPSLLRASLITVLLSCLSMAIPSGRPGSFTNCETSPSDVIE